MGGCFWLARPGLGALVREAGFNGRGLQLAKLAIANPYRLRPSICKDKEGMEAVEVENEAGEMEVNDKRKRKKGRDYMSSLRLGILEPVFARHVFSIEVVVTTTEITRITRVKCSIWRKGISPHLL